MRAMTPDADAASPPDDSEPADTAAEDAGRACDFCGEVVPSVRRVALDGDYERLRTRHQVQYSCGDCFEKKEQQRGAKPA